MKRILGFSLFVILTSLQSVSAHGGEDSKGLSNLQIMLISLAICAVFYLLFRKLSDSESSANNGLLLTLVAYTMHRSHLTWTKRYDILAWRAGNNCDCYSPICNRNRSVERKTIATSLGIIGPYNVHCVFCVQSRPALHCGRLLGIDNQILRNWNYRLGNKSQ